MGGILLLCGFLACGLVCANALFYRRSALARVWLGMCAGLIGMMWLPALWAYALRFTQAAQLCALGCAAVIAAACHFALRGRRREGAGTATDGIPAWLLACLMIPFALLAVWLQYTHTLRPIDGALHVGQSTYGDLCLHLGIASSLRSAAFPPDYNILKGTLLGYPFLADSMVTSMLLFGTSLQVGFVVTGSLMMLLVFLGFILFAWELTRRPAAVVIAFLLMFVNGGLGFLYTFDGVMQDSSALREVFTGFYKTPTNQPDLNLRWVNVICDMMIPQRTLLTGWTVLLPALYQLIFAVKERKAAPFVVLGLWAGAMPMIHTHSFAALGMLSAGAMVYALAAYRPEQAQADRGEVRRALLRGFLLYGCIAAALALPQLLTWAFPQTVGGGSLRFRFNWVNNRGDGRLIDGYFWFWIKNVGLVYLLMVPAALTARKGGRLRMLAVGALVIYAVAETIQFQPNEYDNNKLFYVAFMVMLPAVAVWMCDCWQKLKGLKVRGLAAALTALVCLISGTLSIAREVVSDYQLFGADEVEAARFIEEHTDPDAMFLTGQQHCNAVAALTGRYILCGTGSYLYFHGLDYTDQQYAVRQLLEDPAGNEALFDLYGIEYIYISSHERSNFDVDEAWYDEHADIVYRNESISIYARPAARED